VGEDFALRVSATGNFSDGWQRDAATGQHERNDHAWGTRTALRWSAADDTQAQFTWEHEDLNQRALPSIGLLATPTYNADPTTYIDPRKAPLLNDVKDNREARVFNGTTLRIDHSLSWADFTSTTAWRHFNSVSHEDNDGTNNEATFFEGSNLEANTTWEQEFKLAGHNKTVDWVTGGVSSSSRRARRAGPARTRIRSTHCSATSPASLRSQPSTSSPRPSASPESTCRDRAGKRTCSTGAATKRLHCTATQSGI